MDFTTNFDTRLEQMHRSRECPASEIDAAVAVFERLKTAQAIASSLIGPAPDQTAVVAVFAELCAEARLGQGSRRDA